MTGLYNFSLIFAHLHQCSPVNSKSCIRVHCMNFLFEIKPMFNEAVFPLNCNFFLKK